MKRSSKRHAAILWWMSAMFLLLLPLAARGESGVKRVFLYDPGAGSNYSIPRKNLRKALTQLAKDQDFALTLTRDSKAIAYLDLKPYDVVIFAPGNGGGVWSSQGKADLERYVREGGGFVAVRSSAGPSRDFPFLREAVTAQYTTWSGGTVKARLYADSQAVANPELREIFNGLSREVVLRDRWLNFENNPRENPEVTVLFSVDESSYPFGRMQGDHPVVWTRTMDRGRVVYNGLGHENIYVKQGNYGMRLLWNLIEYAAHKDGNELAKATSLNAAAGLKPLGVTLEGRSMALSLGEGSYSLKVFDSQGKAVLSRTFTGPGQFRTEPISANGIYTAALTGPGTRIRKQFTLR